MIKSHVEESLGANPGDAALNPADSVAMGVQAARAPRWLASTRGRAFRALAHREYRLLFAAFVVNQTGFWLSHISMQGLMVELSGNDPLWLGFLFFALFIPAFVLAPIAGVAADRFDRKRIILICYASVSALMGVLTALTASDALGPRLLLGLALVLGAAFAFSGPASFALAANVVPDADLPSAVSLQSAANNLTRVLGPALAAPLVATSHFEIAFAFFLVAGLVAAVITGLMRVPALAYDDDDSGMLARLRSGFDHARERKPAVPALLTVAALSLFGVSHVALLPVYAEVVLGQKAAFAWLVAATGLGATLGALVTGQRKEAPTLRGSAVRMAGYAIALGVFASTSNLWVALIAQFVIGYFYFSVMTGLQTLIQQIVDDSKRGRVMSLFQVAWAGLVPFGGLGMGIAGNTVGVVATLLGAAACCGAFALAMTWLAGRLSARSERAAAIAGPDILESGRESQLDSARSRRVVDSS